MFVVSENRILKFNFNENFRDRKNRGFELSEIWQDD